MVARNGGTKRIHHFAHYESTECKYGVQTSIHIAAKEILKQSKRIKLPGVTTFINTELQKCYDDFYLDDEEYIFVSHGKFEEISPVLNIKIDDVILEKKLHRFIPDVVIISKNKKLIVEIAVTHFVGRTKLNKIKESEISAIEIDLSKIENDFNLNDLAPLVLDNLENKTWLYNNFAYKKQQELQLENRQEINEKNQKKREKRLKREEWYKDYYKPVINRKVSEDYVVMQIENCPRKIRIFSGQHYASVKSDCAECRHSRWLREDDKYLICLFDYHMNKKKTAPNNGA